MRIARNYGWRETTVGRTPARVGINARLNRRLTLRPPNGWLRCLVVALEEVLRELLAASMEAERARLEALRAWAHFWMQQSDETAARELWASIAGPEQSHFFVRMSRDEARHVLELLWRLDEPEHNAQERQNMIQELRALGLQQPLRLEPPGASHLTRGMRPGRPLPR